MDLATWWLTGKYKWLHMVDWTESLIIRLATRSLNALALGMMAPVQKSLMGLVLLMGVVKRNLNVISFSVSGWKRKQESFEWMDPLTLYFMWSCVRFIFKCFRGLCSKLTTLWNSCSFLYLFFFETPLCLFSKHSHSARCCRKELNVQGVT